MKRTNALGFLAALALLVSTVQTELIGQSATGNNLTIGYYRQTTRAAVGKTNQRPSFKWLQQINGQIVQPTNETTSGWPTKTEPFLIVLQKQTDGSVSDEGFDNTGRLTYKVYQEADGSYTAEVRKDLVDSVTNGQNINGPLHTGTVEDAGNNFWRYKNLITTTQSGTVIGQWNGNLSL